MGGAGFDIGSLFGGAMGGGMGGMGGMGAPRRGSGPQSAPRASSFDELPRGTRVMVRDLKSAAHRNGELGRISGFDKSKGRCVASSFFLFLSFLSVLFFTCFRIRPLTLFPFPLLCCGLLFHHHYHHHHTLTHSLTQSRPFWFTCDNRYTLALEDDEALSCKPENLLQLTQGVEVIGVQKQPELNGAKGTIINFDSEKEK